MPQIEVEEVAEPDLDAQIMAERLAYSLDRGRHYRRAGYYILRKVMDAGARGVEIIVSGKVTSQRARTQIFRAGTIAKSGQLTSIIDKGVAQCILKSGVLGVICKIMRSDIKLGDDIKIKTDLLTKAQAVKEAQIVKTRVDYMIEEKEGPLSEEDKKLLDEVDEESISEISVVPEKEGENEESKKA